ncbi:MAG: hypothetical protein ABSF12_17480 [Bryobacteraceae bacterium]|jgi:hypothetical protein
MSRGLKFPPRKKVKVALKMRYQIEQQRAVQQFRRIATEQNPNIQMILPLADIVGCSRGTPHWKMGRRREAFRLGRNQSSHPVVKLSSDRDAVRT